MGGKTLKVVRFALVLSAVGNSKSIQKHVPADKLTKKKVNTE